MDDNVTGKLKDAVTSKLAGFPEQRRKVVKDLDYLKEKTT